MVIKSFDKLQRCMTNYFVEGHMNIAHGWFTPVLSINHSWMLLIFKLLRSSKYYPRTNMTIYNKNYSVFTPNMDIWMKFFIGSEEAVFCSEMVKNFEHIPDLERHYLMSSMLDTCQWYQVCIFMIVLHLFWILLM